MSQRPDTVDFHFDVMCPYAYQTSLWIRSVRERTGLVINWRFFSLEEVNRVEGKKHPWERDWSYGWSMMRVGALLRRRDMAELDAWYARAGRALHVEGHKPHVPDVARALLEELGLDPGLVDEASPTRAQARRYSPNTNESSMQAASVSPRSSSPTGSASSAPC